MDQIDLLILQCLNENARMRASEIAQRAGMSVSTITERMRKLEQSGVILGYKAILDPIKLNRTFEAFITISSEHPRYMDTLCEQILEDPNVIECSILTGELDFIVRVSATSPEHFQQIHLRMTRLEGVKSIKSYYALSTRTNPRFSPVG